MALGEADETWPRIVADAVRHELKDIYAPVDEKGEERKPSLQSYPSIPWDSINLDQFNVVPNLVAPLLRRVGGGWGTFRIIPVESGRGCPYGCEFWDRCTVNKPEDWVFYLPRVGNRSNHEPSFAADKPCWTEPPL